MRAGLTSAALWRVPTVNCWLMYEESRHGSTSRAVPDPPLRATILSLTPGSLSG